MIEKGIPIYAMNFEIIKDLPHGYFLKFLFENPRKRQPPITETRRLEIEGNSILVQSIPLECIRNKKNYSVTVEIYSDELTLDLISTHKQKIEFRLPQEIIEQVGVPIC